QRGPLGRHPVARGVGRPGRHDRPAGHLHAGDGEVPVDRHLQRQRDRADRPVDHRVGHRGAEGALAAGHPRRVGALVPGLLGAAGNGWLVSMGALGQERVGSSGQAISMAQDLRTLLQTAKAENPDALRDPAIRERVAELHMQIDFTRLLIARALSKVLKGEKGWPEVPLAKLQWGYISLWLAELALDILGPTGALLKGAPGAIDGGVWARNYVWQRYTTIGAGPTEVQKNIIAYRALGLER